MKFLDETGLSHLWSKIKNLIPTKLSQLTNDKGYITSYTETDPTVPTHVKNITSTDITNWNNKSTFSGSYNDLTDVPAKFTPTSHTHHGYYYKKEEVDAMIPTNMSQLTNDSGFITGYTETDPTVPNHVKSITQEQINTWDNLKESTLPTAGGTMTGNIIMTAGTNIVNSASGGIIKFLENGNIRIDTPLADGSGNSGVVVGVNGVNILIGTTNVIQATTTGINVKQNMDMTNHSLVNLPTPSNSTDAVNKEYVDNNFINNSVVTAFWTGTQAQYDAIATKSPTTLYLIPE